MKPFALLIHERSQDLARCVHEADALIQRKAGVSGSQKITLDEASWLAAVIFLGIEQAKKQFKEQNVITVVATDTMEAKDSAA